MSEKNIFGIRNDKPFEHICSNGTTFKCERCDFREPILVSSQPLGEFKFANDVAEMIGFHATNIWPNLNGFQGYDTITFVDVKNQTKQKPNI